tara:strand:+ start:581 stop:1045 length:465 start_codon:yes stop_codon:yes gene_type:complete
MNKDQLTARAQELGLDTDALDAATKSKTGKATNAELKAAIDAKEAELNTAALQKQAQDLGIDTEGLDTDEKLQAAIDEKTPPAPKNIKVNDAEEVSAERKSWQDPEGRVWFFKPNAPKTINIDGRPLSQAEILESEDVISELAYGNSSFLTQNY